MFHLLLKVSKAHYHLIRKKLNKIGLHKGQPRLLHLLWKREGRTQRELCDNLHLKAATVAKTVKRMEKSGFIIKKKDAEDRRLTRIYLTEAGHEIKTRVDEIEKEIEEQILDGFNDEERILLRRFFVQIRNNLQNN